MFKKNNNEYESLRKILIRLNRISDEINLLRTDINIEMGKTLKKKERKI